MKLFLCFILLMSCKLSLAKTLGRVSGIEGNAFVFYGKMNSATLKYGDKITSSAEIMVEDGGHISIYDDLGRTFHLSGGSHIKLTPEFVEVKNGKIWVRSESGYSPFSINTVNSTARFKQGQFIFSFSNLDGKTQLLVLDGKVGFNNVLEPELGVLVESGYFSVIDNNYNQGLPRTATRVGLNSYKQTKQAFYGIEEIDNTDFESTMGATPSRSVASVAQPNTGGRTHGKVYFISSKGKGRSLKRRIPASVDKELSGPAAYLAGYLKQKSPHKTKNLKDTKTAKIRIFGGVFQNTSVSRASSLNVSNTPKKGNAKRARIPASVKSGQVVTDLNNTFEKSLDKKIQIDKRHPEEVNQLIDELKSYDQNFSKSY